jgi:hypothetical protein
MLALPGALLLCSSFHVLVAALPAECCFSREIVASEPYSLHPLPSSESKPPARLSSHYSPFLEAVLGQDPGGSALFHAFHPAWNGSCLSSNALRIPSALQRESMRPGLDSLAPNPARVAPLAARLPLLFCAIGSSLSSPGNPVSAAACSKSLNSCGGQRTFLCRNHTASSLDGTPRMAAR